MTNDTPVKISKKEFKAGISDPVQSAKVVNLTYVNNGMPGYTRKRYGKSFTYYDGNKELKDSAQLERIRKLVIPPAWENVWVCKLPDGHLQVTGTDNLGRKQYKYHPNWSMVRNQTKFYRLAEFGSILPRVRNEIKKKLSLPGYPKEKVLAALISILETTNIRIGNAFYEKLYGSFGLTTLKNRHVNINGSKVIFSFIGKKGVKHSVPLKSKKLSKIIKGCKEISGKYLFEYIDDDGVVHEITSGLVNEFIHELTGGDFTAKDFRTWSGSVQAIRAFKELGNYESETEMKHKLAGMFEAVAGQLGNTKAVCKKYYIHPAITDLYENNKLEAYICDLKLTEPDEERTGLSAEEKILLKILEKKVNGI